MAELYAGKKFDDPERKVDPAVRKIYGAFPKEDWRRALQGITNRQLGTAAGTGYNPTLAVLADGGTGGIKTTNQTSVVINGAVSSCIAQDNLKMPGASADFTGTQGANTVAKYLVCTAAGTSGTIIGPGNIISKADYSTIALANAAAKLPDLPDGYCALGYATFNTPTASAVVVSSCGLLSTAGTVAYVDLICMPYNA
jgi:hypothetical protein